MGSCSATATDYDVNFPTFDVVNRNPTDHYFSKQQGQGGVNKHRCRRACKRITQEWRQLSQDLPDSIYVRVYETRIFLIRAAIVGAAGTPYQDFLFFFDIAFPSDYPSNPPLVYYHSFGYRINPNLYEDGQVCLSLINTWIGGKEETWDRNRSTISQLLLSIQALVLNEQPYFNEAGYAGYMGSRYRKKKSAEYNEQVFLLCCKTALCLLRNPPQDFNTLVRRHFSQNSVRILTACNGYRNRVQAMIGGGIGAGVNLVKFKKDVEMVYGKMVDAIASNGEPVRNFVDQLAEERTKAKAETDAAKKEKEKEKKKKKMKSLSIAKVLGKVKKIWCGIGRSKKRFREGIQQEGI